jgi:hypothetical protein
MAKAQVRGNITEQQVQIVLGSYSIASVRSWLKGQGLTYSANTRAALTKRVHGLIEEGKVSYDEVIEGLIDIEEASSKHVHLFRFQPNKSSIAGIDKQLSELKIPLSNERSPAVATSQTPKRIYVIDSPNELRVKWAERQIKVEADRVAREFKESPVTKLVVLVLDKGTGIAQLRYDAPETEHYHKTSGRANDSAYYRYFMDETVKLTGLAFEQVELRPRLKKIIDTEPRIVLLPIAEHQSADGGFGKNGHRGRDKDVRDTIDYKSMKANGQTRIFDAAPLKWLASASKGNLSRDVRCKVNGREGVVSFDADCQEAELSYVLSQTL